MLTRLLIKYVIYCLAFLYDCSFSHTGVYLQTVKIQHNFCDQNSSRTCQPIRTAQNVRWTEENQQELSTHHNQGKVLIGKMYQLGLFCVGLYFQCHISLWNFFLEWKTASSDLFHFWVIIWINWRKSINNIVIYELLCALTQSDNGHQKLSWTITVVMFRSTSGIISSKQSPNLRLIFFVGGVSKLC